MGAKGSCSVHFCRAPQIGARGVRRTGASRRVHVLTQNAGRKDEGTCEKLVTVRCRRLSGY